MSAYKMRWGLFAAHSTQEILFGHNNVIASSQLIFSYLRSGSGCYVKVLGPFNLNLVNAKNHFRSETQGHKIKRQQQAYMELINHRPEPAMSKVTEE